MPEAPVEPQDRLDSWKAIAEYLDRDVATVRRWEKSQGLPVRRVPGGRGRSVFAFRHEIDEWLKSSHPTDTPAEAPEPAAPVGARRPTIWSLAVAAAVVMMLVGVVWGMRGSATDAARRVAATPNALVAYTPDQQVAWRYDFPAGRIAAIHSNRPDGAATRLPDRQGFIVGVESTRSGADEGYSPGELLWFGTDGQVRKRATFDASLDFGRRRYEGPWMLADYRLAADLDPRRIAVAFRHVQWWPSVVTVLDADWKPTQKFVNAGWIEHLAWLREDRLLISGYYNPMKAGMVALLDPTAMNGQSPPHEDAEFTCTSCGGAAPLRYILLPRSEVNLAVEAPFNRASLQPANGRIVVRTVEEPNAEGHAAEALYEFSPDLELLVASYGDRYWDRHRALEVAGKIDHPRERCPERRGPPFILVWDAAAGWKKVHPPED